MNDIDSAKESIVEEYGIGEWRPSKYPKTQRAQSNAREIDQWQSECVHHGVPCLKAQLIEELAKRGRQCRIRAEISHSSFDFFFQS